MPPRSAKKASRPKRGALPDLGIPLLLLAVAVRLLFVRESSDFAPFAVRLPGLDVDLYWRAAMQVRAGWKGPSFELMVLSAPLHVYWTAMMQTLFGESMVLHRYLMGALGGLTAWSLYRTARRMTAVAWAAAAATLLIVLLPSAIVMDTRLMKMGLELLLIAHLFELVLKAMSWTEARKQVGAGLAAGAILGLLFLSQILTVLYFIPVAACWLLAPELSRKDKGRLLGPALAVFLAVFLTNQIVKRQGEFPHFVPQGGVDVYIGYYPRATGYYTPLPDMASSPIGQVFDAKINAQAEEGRVLTPDEVNRHYIAKAQSFITENPGQAVGLLLRKLHLFLNDVELHTEDHITRLRDLFAMLSLSPFGFGWLVLFAAFGAWSLGVSRRYAELALLVAMVGAVFVPNAIAFVSWRFRLHALVPLALLTAEGFRFIAAHLRGPRARFAIPAAALAIAAVTLYPAMSEAERKRMYDASLINEKVCERIAKDTQPPFFGPVASDPARRRVLARRLAMLQRHTEAFVQYEGAVPSPDDSWANTQYLMYLLWLGDEKQAALFSHNLHSVSPAALDEILAKARQPLRKVVEKRFTPREASAL